MKKIFYNSSLPRSGSTLISNLVAQNPNFYCTPTSGLGDLILNAKNTYAHSQAILSQDKEVMERAFLGFCRAGMQGFFNNITPKEFIVDKLLDVGYDKNSLEDTVGGMFYATKRTMWLPQDTKPGKCPVIPYKRNVIENKITIAPESLKEIAQWNYSGNAGWQQVVNEIVNSGFKISNVSYENTMNLKNVNGVHGNKDIRISLFEILESRLFVGLSSGLAWLAWAYGVPVVMISSFTKSHNEFDCFRVVNPNSCSGCFNTFQNIKTKCPLFFGTERENECHKTITPKMIINKIKEALLFTTDN